MRTISTLLTFLAFTAVSSAQNSHELHMTGEEFDPDTLYMAPGDLVLLTFDTLGHSLVQVPEESWGSEVAFPLIGLSMGEGTPNPGDIHEFSIDSTGTFYYLCQQHTDEKGVFIVDEEYTSIHELDLPGFKVFPQPASDHLRLEHDQQYTSIRIDDHQGRPVRTVERRATMNGVDVSSLSAGIYFITLLDGPGVPVARQKVIISR